MSHFLLSDVCRRREGGQHPHRAVRLLRVLFGLMLLTTISQTARGAAALEDANGILYAVDVANRTAVVSAENATKFNGISVDLVIPAVVTDHKTLDRYEGEFTVVGMEKAAFRNTGITGITIEANITTIPEDAFYYCQSLVNVSLPASLELIDKRAFYYTQSLGDVIMPENLRVIEENAFYNSAIKSLTLNTKLESAQRYAFNSCYQLTTLTIPDGCHAIFEEYSMNFGGLKSLKLPAGITAKSNSFCYLGSLTELILPDQPFNVEANAFTGLYALQKLTIPGWMKEVKSYFQNTTNMTEITFEEGVEILDKNAIYSYNMETVHFPSTLRVMREEAMVGGAKVFEFPERMDSIGRNAFKANCDVLKIPKGVHVGEYALSGTYTKVKWPEIVTEADIPSFDQMPFGWEPSVTELTIPGYLKTVPPYLCYNARNLKTLIIEDGVEEIGEHAFEGGAMESLTIPSSVKRVNDWGFSSLQYLAELNFSPGLEYIGTGGFSLEGWDAPLERVVLPESLVYIGNDAFRGIGHLKYLSIPSTLREIGDYAFLSSCGDELEIVFAEGLEKIGNQAFYGLQHLKNFKLPRSLRSIGVKAFAYSGPMDVIDMSNVTYIGDYAFQNSCGESVIFPESSEAVYGKDIFKDFYKQNEEEAADDEKKYFAVTLPEGMAAVPANMFNGFTNLNSVVIPQGNVITKIGAGAFGNTSIKTFGSDTYAWPESVKEVGDFAYEEIEISVIITPGLQLSEHALEKAHIMNFEISEELCDDDYRLPSFKDVVFPTKILGHDEAGTPQYQYYTLKLPDCIKTIPANCFEGITGVRYIELPASLEVIEDEAFMGSSILDLSFENTPNIRKIGDNAFKMSHVNTVTWPDHAIEVGKGAFHCADISNLTIPAWMEEIPEYCFADQGGHEEMVLYIRNSTQVWHSGYRYSGSLHTLTFEDRTAPLVIGKHAFAGNINIYGTDYSSGLTLPECDITIGEKAFFMNCFQAITWPETHNVILKNEAFRHSPKLAAITLPKNVILDGEDIFRAAINLRTVTITAPYTKLPAGTFQNCRYITGITFNPELEEIGSRAFMNTASLTYVTLPSKLRVIGDHAFTGAKLCTLTLPESTEEVGDYAFAATDIRKDATYTKYGLHLNKGLKRIGSYAFVKAYDFSADGSFSSDHLVRKKIATDTIYTFYVRPQYDWAAYSVNKTGNATFSEVTIPESVEFIGMNAFYGCTGLANLVMEGQNIRVIGQSAFSKTGLTELDLDFSGLDLDLGSGVFGTCASLKKAKFTAGSVSSLQQFLAGCSALEEAEITVGGTANCERAFNGDASLTKLTISADSVNIGEYAFSNCKMLVTPTFNSSRLTIGNYAFQDAQALEQLLMPEDAEVHAIGSYAFNRCYNLKSVPWLRNSKHVNSSAFQNCTSLREVEYPLVGMVNDEIHKSYYHGDAVCGDGTMGEWDRGFFSGCSSLQSVTFHSTGNVFKIDESDLYNAPLKGVSYFEGKVPRIRQNLQYWNGDYPVPEGTLGWYKFDPYNSYYNTRDPKPLLYVERGQKWKFCEAGYGKLFDILERKNPVINLRGDIFSEFDLERNINSYTAVLSWDLQLSDLNSDAPTHFSIYRDGDVLVADATFSKPEKVKVTTFEGVNEAYKVTVDIKAGTALPSDEQLAQGVLFSGYIDYVDEDDPTGLTYKSMNVTQNRDLYFDAASMRRLDSFDRWSDYSPFIFVERFESPELNSGIAIPASYNYTAVMDGYDYKEFVNNDGLAEGEDGVCYHEVAKTLEPVSSGVVSIYPAAVLPSIDFPGLYTRDEVLADHDASLAVSIHPSSSDGLSIDYEIAGDLAKQIGNDTFNNETGYIVRDIEVYTTDSDGNRRLIGTITPEGESTGSIPLDTEAKLAPNTRYQFVTNTMFRGKFGSPVMTIPGVPWMGISRSRTTADCAEGTDNHDEHVSSMACSDIRVRYHVADMGYNEAEFDPTDLEVSFPGIWRGFESGMAYRAPRADNSSFYANNTTVFHYDSHHESAPDCSACADLETYEIKRPYYRWVDVYPVDEAGTFEGVYTVRHYVKVPTHMLHNDNQWMVAEIPVSFGSKIAISGVEDVSVDGDVNSSDEDARWFRIDGIEVAHPVDGEMYIRVDANGARKVLYHAQ